MLKDIKETTAKYIESADEDIAKWKKRSEDAINSGDDPYLFDHLRIQAESVKRTLKIAIAQFEKTEKSIR
jgi:hypothetical protein